MWSYKWLNSCSEGRITSGKVETRIWGEKELFHMGQLRTDNKREGITASVKLLIGTMLSVGEMQASLR